MGDLQPSPPAEKTTLVTADQMALLTFLREEAEANRKAQRDESNANRQLIIDTLKIVSPILTAVILFAGFWGFHDLHSARETIKNEADTELSLELAREKGVIDKRIEADVADKFKLAEPLIRTGVDSQVQKAVATQNGLITKIATQAIGHRVDQTIRPLESSLHASQLYLRVSEDDDKAYDELISIKANASATDQEFINRAIADFHATLAGAGKSALSGNDHTKCAPKSESLRNDLKSTDSSIRITALENCLTWLSYPDVDRISVGVPSPVWHSEQDLIPDLVTAAATDDSLTVRGLAISAINYIFSHSPGFPGSGLDILSAEEMKAWWKKSEPDYRTLELISRVESEQDVETPQSYKNSKANVDDSDLYEALERERSRAKPALADAIDAAVLKMRQQAKMNASQDPREDLKNAQKGSCAEVEKDFNLSPQALNALKENISSLETRELFFAASCPPSPKDLPLVIKYATGSHSLSRRFAATQLLNSWTGQSFDPFKSEQTLAWWKMQSAAAIQ